MIARSCMALVVCLILASGPASAQRLDEQVAAAAAGFAARAATAVASTLPVDDLIVKAIKRVSERDYPFAALLAPPSTADAVDCSGIDSCDRDERGTPEKTALERENSKELSGWQQLMVEQGLKYFSRPEAIELVWQGKKKLIGDTVAALAPDRRARLVKTLDATLYAMTVYLSDRSIQQAFMDRRAAYDLWKRERGLRARTLKEAQERLVEREKTLEIDADKLDLADKIWTAGGEPLLAEVLKVGSDLRRELNSRDRTQ